MWKPTYALQRPKAVLTGMSHQKGGEVARDVVSGSVTQLSAPSDTPIPFVSQSHSSQDKDLAGVTGVQHLGPAGLDIL